MRLAKHVKIINSQLENLEDLRSQFQRLLQYIDSIMTEGQSWIDEKENQRSFTEMSNFLTSETSNCIMKCSKIASENDDSFQLSSIEDSVNSTLSHDLVGSLKNDNDYDDVKNQLEELNQGMKNYSTILSQMKEKLKHQKKQTEFFSSQLTETDNKTEIRLELIMKELHAASDFMSNLKSQIEMTTNKNTEYEKRLENRFRKFTELEEQMKLIITNRDSEVKLQALKDEIEKNMDTLSGAVQSLKLDFEKKLPDILSEVEGVTKDILELKNLNKIKNVAFSVGLSQDKTFLVDAFIIYDVIFTNIGDHYSLSTGIFTCPLGGLYVFNFYAMASPNNKAELRLFHNSSFILSVHADDTYNIGKCGNSVILRLKANDQVYIKANTDSELIGPSLSLTNTFCGFLLSAD